MYTKLNIILLFILICSSVSAQTKKDMITPEDIRNLPETDSIFIFYPLARDTTGNYPKQLNVKGKIIEITEGTSCGVFCGCGTIKVELSDKLEGYSEPHVFIAIPCFNVNSKEFLNKRVEMKVELLSIDNNDCFWNEAPRNSLDSKGIQFYIPKNLDENLHVD